MIDIILKVFTLNLLILKILFQEFVAAEIKIVGMFQQQGMRGKLNAPVKLKDYCAWLAEFNPNKYGRDLEIPGKYELLFTFYM